MTCIYDIRWNGEHGIGRFANEISKRLPHTPLSIGGKPMSPFDPFKLIIPNITKGDWFFSPGYNAPILHNIPYLLTIHDLNHIDRSDNSGFLKKIYYATILRRLCLRSRAVLTVSEFSRQRIIEWFKVNPSKVFNVGNGISKAFSINGSKYLRANDYMLCVSNRRGHKNEYGLLSAFAKADLPSSLELALTGHPTKNLLDHATSLGIKSRIFFTGHISEEELAKLYRGATALAFPSFYEGFGLPIVEAFACGIPVLTSNVTSMPEIAGDAALLVNPYSIDDITDGLTQIYSDAGLRNKLISRGVSKASSFTWEAVVERINAAVKTVDIDPDYPLNWS